MGRITAAALGARPVMTEAALGALHKGGTSIDACIAGFFAAAGELPGVLLGSSVLLVGGTGVGAHVFDGSVLQPGKGAPRPRGFLESEDVPAAAYVPIPTTGGLLSAAHAHGGSVPLSELATPGVRIARSAKAAGRANLLRRAGAAGPVAFRDEPFVRSMLAIGGRPESGNVTRDDLADAQARVLQAHATDQLVRSAAVDDGRERPALSSVFVAACDPRGVLAVLHVNYDAAGIELEPHEVTVSRFAVPVRRGVPRVRPGEARSLPVPIALLSEKGVPWSAIAFDGVAARDWERIAGALVPGITLDQVLRRELSESGSFGRAVAVVRSGESTRSIEVAAGESQLG